MICNPNPVLTDTLLKIHLHKSFDNRLVKRSLNVHKANRGY